MGTFSLKKMPISIVIHRLHLQFLQSIYNIYPMPSDQDQEKFESFLLPDITSANPDKIKKFSSPAPKWRKIAKGLNLQGMCENEQCEAGAKKSMVWSNFKDVHKCKCPICGVYTQGNKRIGLYKCTLNGRGMKATNSQSSQIRTSDQNGQGTDDQDNDEIRQKKKKKEVEIQFPTIKVDAKDGFLKMDGVNGKFIKWRYMTLQIKMID